MWRSAVQVCLGLHIAYGNVYHRLRMRAWDYIWFSYGGLAQLARAPALQAGGQRFESVILHCPLHEEEIFDILTHKTVSKDFKLRLSVIIDTLNLQLKV